PYIVSQEEYLLEKISIIASDEEMLESLNKSAGTISNVNKRLLRVKQLLSNNEEWRIPFLSNKSSTNF
ncbi:hypothetical protein, partial [Mesomycoplasma ovipneumoniae]|uniref:hypothetical protein n=1 Tax=Mesomycoplasma ovipneumoniae TaxID=29562 RepID=UPI00311966F2